MPKKDNTWLIYANCIAINNIIVKYRYHIPRLNDMLDELHGFLVFSKINLKSGYLQIRMKKEDKWKKTFKTRYGLYEWLIMPLRYFIEKVVVVYFDDILIYIKGLN